MARVQSQRHRCPHTACLSHFPSPSRSEATSQCHPLWLAHPLAPATHAISLSLHHQPVQHAQWKAQFPRCPQSISHKAWTLNVCYLQDIWIVVWVSLYICCILAWVHGVLVWIQLYGLSFYSLNFVLGKCKICTWLNRKLPVTLCLLLLVT